MAYFDSLKKEELLKALKAMEDEEFINPSLSDVFKAFELTPYESLKVVLIGQDPYPKKEDAMGLAFSVPKSRPIPGSLRNIFKVLKDDLNIQAPHGDLSGWAKEGVLLLNKALTVKTGKPLSHQVFWVDFFESVIRQISLKKTPLVFVLMGQEAAKIKPLIADHHVVINTVHPSPLSAHRGFLTSALFKKIQDALVNVGQPPIDFSRFD